MSTPDAHEDVFDQHRATLRAQGFVPNPYRVGVQVGKTGAGIDLPCPYTKSRSINAYRDGVKYGDQWRRQERSLGKKR
jgi:hypothetical protein